jgi:hypothetical protein
MHRGKHSDRIGLQILIRRLPVVFRFYRVERHVAVSSHEYRGAKGRLIEQKKQKEGELAESERHRSGWFEPAIGFVKAAKDGANLALSHDNAEKLKFAKTTGSNFRLVNRELVSQPRAMRGNSLSIKVLLPNQISRPQSRARYSLVKLTMTS